MEESEIDNHRTCMFKSVILSTYNPALLFTDNDTNHVLNLRSITANTKETIASRAMPWKNGEQDAIQHILVIEDDLTLARLETEVLSAHGYTVIFEPHGERAISLLQQALPDLVVLDLELVGDVHGWEVLSALRSHANIPVLITSSSATTARHYRRMSGETRATLDHLAKPYPIETLLKRVKRMLPTSPTQ
ncbi:response regulator [Ktedonobacteria bacterium brp13]|nr:response regulator [Ktedonobacteria bacterium brp13]